MSKFANRNNQKSKSPLHQKSGTKSKSKRSFSNISKALDSERNSQQKVFSIEQNITPAEQDSEILNLKYTCESEELSSQIIDAEESIVKRENDSWLEEGKLDMSSDDSCKRSLNIHSKYQVAEFEFLTESGLEYYQQKDYKQCISCLERALNTERMNVKINYYLGMSHYQLLQMDKSLEYFVRVSPSNNCKLGYVETFFWIGEIYRQQQKLSEASNNYQKFLSLAPDNTYSALALKHLTSIKLKNLFG